MVADVAHAQNGCLVDLPLDRQVKVCRPWRGKSGVGGRGSESDRSKLREIYALIANWKWREWKWIRDATRTRSILEGVGETDRAACCSRAR